MLDDKDRIFTNLSGFNDWTLDGVRLVARTASTGLLVFNEQDMDFYMDAGDIWAPSCTF